MVATNLETFALDNSDTIFRFLVYRRMYTPYEQAEKYIDESFYEDDHYFFGYLENVIDLGYGNWLLGFRLIDDCNGEKFDNIEYYKLDEIRLSYFDDDQKLSDIAFEESNSEHEEKRE